MRLLPALPVLVYLVGAALTLLFHPRRYPQRLIASFSCVGALLAGVALTILNYNGRHPILQLGNWRLPFGIVYVADPLACAMIIATAIVGLGCTIYGWSTLREREERLYYHFFFLALLAGVSAAFLTGDLFHLFVCFEILLVASFALLSLGSSRAQLASSVKYVTINLIGSLIFLTAVGLIYAQTGTLNLADLALKAPQIQAAGPWLPLSGIMMLVAFGIKAGTFPFFFWLPDAYQTPPAAIAALFAGLLTKVGVYALLRIFPLVYFPLGTGFSNTFLLIGAITMTVGVMGAVAQTSMRKILSVHIISQIGYMVLAIGLRSPAAIAGAIFFVLHNMITKTNLFFVSGLIEKINGSDSLDRTGSLAKIAPGLGAVFLISALSLAGLPPLSGFFAKFFLAYTAADSKNFWALALMLAVSLLTLYSMLKIWNHVFWRPLPAAEGQLSKRTTHSDLWPAWVVTTSFAVLVAAMGLLASPIYDFLVSAATYIADPAEYINFVLGDKP